MNVDPVQVVRMVQVVVLIIFIAVLCIGPGFYMRQEWRGFTKNFRGQTDKLVQCGVVATQSTTWADLSKGCAMKSYPDLPVATLKGYNGYCTVLMWKEMRMYGQFGCLLLPLGLIVTSIGLMVTLTPAMDRPPKVVVILIGSLSAMLMLVIMALQWYYIGCGGYTHRQLVEFDKKIKEKRAEKELTGMEVSKEDKVVECKVQGYGISAFFALLSSLIYIVEVLVYFTMKPVDKLDKTLLQESSPAEDVS